ncbi:MAG: NAD(P)/FAD-dependent oxidoreductase [Proteobacteria bacterium]|nr:NAD(P)/FAD-dependent oxidoreductase [Pseudomonadota bacterium]HQR04282.1 nitrite reductase large subunit NirB [Rhodocyclaceae bacterium]
MRKSKLVLVGNGMAGVRTIEELLKLAPDLYDITVYGAEPHGNYNRILLSPVLAGEMKLPEIMLNDVDWYSAHGITLRSGRQITRIDRIHRTVIADDGSEEPYDRLLLATGSTPVMLPIPGHDLPGVLAYRDIADTEAIIAASAKGGHAVVIGAGLLGLEAANGLKARGMEVTVVHLAPWIMERQLDRTAADMLRTSLEARGLRFLLEKKTVGLVGEPKDSGGRVSAVRFADGDELSADLVVMAIGIRPNIRLAEDAGLHCNHGILVNDTLQTYDPRIYAVGECVAHRGTTYGLVAPLFEQAKVAANHLAEFGIARYSGSAVSTKLKVTGVDVFSAGDFMGGDDTDEIILADRKGGIYKKLVLRDNRIVGAVLYGDTADSGWYFQLMKEKKCIGSLRDRLMLGQSHNAGAGHEGRNRAVALPDDFEVCGCNGVKKISIVKAIKEKGLFTLEDVRKHTKASVSCGSCTGLVEQILASEVGGAYQPVVAQKKPLCGCTDFTHEEVRKAIIDHRLMTIPEAMRFLEWRQPSGCPSCRPALNFYLLCAWPKEYRDDPQSRFINERVHANIQKDGSFSVVPRIYGGVTSPAELKRIAEVAEKYAVPTVKITGGQRIDLLGVKKEDLPSIWADLDMPSGYAYSKGLRTVKTCVGSEWCRFGVQDSTRMGIDLEHDLERLWTPHKTKLGVSGCPRNCAEATIKDVGVIGVDSGWEIYVAGNGGIKTEVAQFLCKVKTQEEVLETTGAFLQLYREEARYLDRTVHWIGRVGLDYVRKRVVDDADGRRALYARMKEALSVEKDPWAERASDHSDTEFKPVKFFVKNSVSTGGSDERLAENLSA